MAYLTDRELIERFEFYTLQIEGRLLEGENYKTLIDHIPCATLLGDPQAIEVQYTNKRYTELTRYSQEEIRRDGPRFLESILHPGSLKSIMKFLPEFYATSDPHQTLFYAQYARAVGGTDYFPTITFTKGAKLPNGLVLNMLLPIEELDKTSSKIAKIVEMDEFKLTHFKRFQQLTQREIEILVLLAEGLNNPAIADRLFISRQTVETHRKHINRKLGIKHYQDVIKYALAFDLVTI